VNLIKLCMSVQHLIDDVLSNLVEKMEVSQEKESTDEFYQVVHTSIQHLIDDVLSNLTENSKTEERWGSDCMGEKERLAVLSEVFEDMASEEAGRHVVCMPLQYLIDDCVLRHLAEKMEDVSEEEIRGAGKGRSGLRLEARRHQERRDDGILHDQQQFEIPRNFECCPAATWTEAMQHVDNLQPKPMAPHFDGMSVDMDEYSAQ